MTRLACRIKRPRMRSTSVVFSSPHSGRAYPEAFLDRAVLDETEIRSSEDAFVDELFGAAQDVGAPLIYASAPRAYVDLNRAPDELDPALIQGVRRSGHNPRIASGLGVIPRVVANGRPIYRGKISREDAQARLDTVWHPYHRGLQTLLDESRALFGEAILVDCHSMPHEALDGISPPGMPRPEVVLGDRFGAAASEAVLTRIELAFQDAGLRVVRNMPFAGAYIVQTYGRPSRQQYAVQIEIDRALYMDERTITPNADFEGFQALMTRIVSDIADIGRPEQRVAAE
ncbi:N-formylglutamate amidohydrolase [Aestuariibius sp. 2305UL40-4]|uniref:N-formylglutamate amidohydrolase n=1 Tax=Aestuariibius violaceus TaxID=3234132 RepID=UPI00345EECFE